MNIFKAQAVKDPEAIARAIPVIDIAPAFAGGSGLERVAAQVREASERVGFFYVALHGVPQATIELEEHRPGELRIRRGGRTRLGRQADTANHRCRPGVPQVESNPPRCE